MDLKHYLAYFILLINFIYNVLAEDAMRFTSFELIPSLNDYIITDSASWVKNHMRSSVDCFVACMEETGCKSVFYNKLTRDCIAHSSVHKSIDTAAEDAGSRYYKNLNPTVPTSHAIESCGADGSGPDGMYLVSVGGTPLNVWCDMTTDGGNWLVVQRRFDGHVNFDRSWDDYKNGFGDVDDEFWIGNDNIHHITNEHSVEVRFDLNFTDGNISFARYSTFAVGDEASGYLVTVDGYDSAAVPYPRDTFRWNNDHKFTTFDRDYDDYPQNCATYTKGGWWFANCGETNLNGRFNTQWYFEGAQWNRKYPEFQSSHRYKLQATAMKLRVKPNVDD